MNPRIPSIIVALVALLGCGSPQRPARTSPDPTAGRIPISQLPAIDADAVLAHTKVLSSDRFEGRAPGTQGEELTTGYLVDELRRMGLKPGNADGTFIQKVP